MCNKVFGSKKQKKINAMMEIKMRNEWTTKKLHFEEKIRSEGEENNYFHMGIWWHI